MIESHQETPLVLRLFAVVGVVLVIAFIGSSLFGEGGVTRHEKLRDELITVKSLNAKLASENRRLDAEVEALERDERYIEHVIRDELGWVAADEVVLIFPRDDAAP